MKKIPLYIFVIIFSLAGFVSAGVEQNFSGDIIPNFTEAVVINEFESNPNFGNEWVEIYNADNLTVNISGWQIFDGVSSETLRHTVPSETFIASGEFYTADVSGLNNGGDFVTLKNRFGVIADQTPELSDTSGDDRSWQRIPNGFGDFVFQEQTRGETNDVLANISGEVSPPMCVFESDDITLTAIVENICNDNVVFQIDSSEGTFEVNTTTDGSETYSATISANMLPPAESIEWRVLAEDCQNQIIQGETQTFELKGRTELQINPASPNGENGWYISQPLFTLSNPSDGEIRYRWNGEYYDYSGPFRLEGTPNNGNLTGGIHTLKYWINSSSGGEECIEEDQSFTGMFDFTNPEITDLTPEPGSMVSGSSIIISAYLDERYAQNSGIDPEITALLIDGNPVNAQIEDVGSIDAVISYETGELEDGLHTATVFVQDFSGRSNEVTWNFSVDTTAFDLHIEMPIDGNVYDSRRVPINISTSVESDMIEYINYNDRRPRYRRICNNCFGYGFDRNRLRSFPEGPNNVTFRAIDSQGNVVERNVMFLIDSRDPRLNKVEPRRGFTSGAFEIQYSEDNPVSLTLHYGNGTLNRTHIVDISNECYDDTNRQICETNVEVGEFNGQEIEHYATIVDILGNSDSSRAREVEIDTAPPDVVEFNYTIDGRRVEFYFEIDEQNFDEINYIDYTDSRPRFRRLCSRIDDLGVCERTRSFRRGEHVLDLYVIDEAENIEIIAQNLTFEID